MPGYQIDGVTILNDQFNLHHINSWGMFGVLLAWIALFRLLHYAVFAYEVLPYTTKSSKIVDIPASTSIAITTIYDKQNSGASMKYLQSDGEGNVELSVIESGEANV